jgi:site-specific DNA recombinase
MSLEHKPVIRCAIYTRKSSEEGLEQSFNSLDAQRILGSFHSEPAAGRLARRPYPLR